MDVWALKYRHLWCTPSSLIPATPNGYPTEALKVLQRLTELATPSAEIWWLKGNQFCKLGRYEEAITSYDKALELKPDLHQAWTNRGVALGNLGRYEEAIASYDKALEIKPDDPKSGTTKLAVMAYRAT